MSSPFSDKHENKYLKSYLNKKPKSYESLDNGIDNSDNYNNVGGITFSKRKNIL